MTQIPKIKFRFADDVVIALTSFRFEIEISFSNCLIMTHIPSTRVKQNDNVTDRLRHHRYCICEHSLRRKNDASLYCNERISRADDWPLFLLNTYSSVTPSRSTISSEASNETNHTGHLPANTS